MSLIPTPEQVEPSKLVLPSKPQQCGNCKWYDDHKITATTGERESQCNNHNTHYNYNMILIPEHYGTNCQFYEERKRMTIGTSKEELRRLRDHYFSLGINPVIDINNLIEQCTELNPWLPIENASKERPINIYDTGYGQVVVSWNEFYKCFTDPHGHRYLSPTHYQELPETPL